MHEYSIVQSLLQRVAVEAEAHRAIAVHGIKVKVGELSGVDMELLTLAYDTFKEGSPCARATLEVERVEARWRCPRCEESIPRGELLRCAACNHPADLISGDEILLEKIDLEIP